MAKPLTIPKITSPILPEVIERHKLFAKLDDALSYNVTWINAPAGSGKTTLVKSFLDARTYHHIWYRVDPRDEDLATFSHYLGMSLQDKLSDQILLPHLNPFFAKTPDLCFLSFFETLFSSLKHSTIFVFEDIHEISDSSPLHLVLAIAATQMLKDHGLIITSRDVHPSVYSKLRASRQMAFLNGDDLKFNENEAKLLVELIGVDGEWNDQWRSIFDVSEGWASGIVLLSQKTSAESEKSDHKNFSNSGGINPSIIFDYFNIELFEKLDPELRNVAIKTAYLPDISEMALMSVANVSCPKTEIDKLIKSRIFTEYLGSDSKFFRYHQLFSDFLKIKAENSMTSEELNNLIKKTASFLEEKGDFEEAFELYSKIGFFEGKQRIILNQAGVFLSQGRYSLLSKWLKTFSEEELQQFLSLIHI